MNSPARHPPVGVQVADLHEASTVRTRFRGLFRFCGWLVDEDEDEDEITEPGCSASSSNRPIRVLLTLPTSAPRHATFRRCPGSPVPGSPSAP